MNISSVSRASNVVTVTTATAHGLSVGQSATHSGITDSSFNGIYTVASVTDATHYTFSQTAANASSSGGTVLPTKQIIVLGYDTSQEGGKAYISVILWFAVTAGNEFPIAGAASQFSRATSDENAAIAAGRLVERSDSFPLPASYTPTQIEAFLATMYSSILSFRNGQSQLGQYYGFFTPDNGLTWPRA